MLKISFLLFAIGVVSGVQVVFDKATDTGNILDISCPYNEDYADFFVFGCPREPKEEASPDRVGFWTGCKEPCTLTYFGGLLPKPKKLLVAAYMEGYESAISVGGKGAPTDPEYGIDFGKIETGDEIWCYREVELEGEGGSSPGVINFNLTGSTTGGYVLIDSIIFDLGNQPIPPISIDVKEDELPQHWPFDDCEHVPDYDDFAKIGCQVIPEEINPTPEAIGYWSPCQKQSCKIQYATSPSIVPNSVTIKGYVEGEGNIMVKLVSEAGTNNFTVIDTKSARLGGWIEFPFDLSSYKQYKLDIVLERGNGGIAMLDSISYSFPEEVVTKRQNDLPLCNPKQTTTTPPPTTPEVTVTTPLPTTPEVTTTTPTTEQTTQSSVTSVIPTSIVFICSVIARMGHF